jgi:hypothetical protein
MFEVLVRGRVARPVEDLDDDTLKAIANSAVAPEFAALDEIVKDWSPGANPLAGASRLGNLAAGDRD